MITSSPTKFPNLTPGLYRLNIIVTRRFEVLKFPLCSYAFLIDGKYFWCEWRPRRITRWGKFYRPKRVDNWWWRVDYGPSHLQRLCANYMLFTSRNNAEEAAFRLSGMYGGIDGEWEPAGWHPVREITLRELSCFGIRPSPVAPTLPAGKTGTSHQLPDCHPHSQP